jgi:hypothetical protein
MKKTIISLSLVAGLILCGGLYSSNKVIEVQNNTITNISTNLSSIDYAIGNTTNGTDPGIIPPA